MDKLSEQDPCLKCWEYGECEHCTDDNPKCKARADWELQLFLRVKQMDEQQTSHACKRDDGKLKIRLVPTQIIRDIAEVRMYGTQKYGDEDGWKGVENYRYVDALLRHTLAFLDDCNGVDPESGIPHYKHMACNMAFICENFKDL